MQLLLEKASNFAKLADATFTVARNSDGLLKELSEIKGFKSRVKFAKEHWEELGEGSSRTIFRLSESLVLKVAHNVKGIQQNLAEANLKNRSSCTNNVMVAQPKGLWVIVPWTDSISEEEFEEIIGISFRTFGAAVYYAANNEIHEGRPKEYDRISQHPFFKCILKAVIDNQLQVGDTVKISSWGFDPRTEKPVLRDFGLTKEIWWDYYSDDDDNSTNTPE